MSRTNTTAPEKTAPKKSPRWSAAALLKTADSLDKQAADKFRDRPTHTPRMLKHARSAEREGAQLQRAAEFIRAYCDMLEHGDRPAALDGFVPSKDRFLQIAARKGVMVSYGYHGYYVDGPEWIDSSPEAEAVRALADNAKTPEQQGERGGVSPPVNSPRQLEIKRMTPQAEVMWLDGLEKLPAKTVVVFTTNNLHRLTDRFIRRCEVQRFDATSDEFRDGMVDVVRQVWKRETGADLDTIPLDLGKFERAGDEYSIGLALQQIAPYLRTGDPLPASFAVPIVREDRRPKLVASYGSTKVAEFAASRKGKRKLA